MKTLKITILFIFLLSSAFSQRFGTGLTFDDKKYKKVPTKAPLTRSLYTSVPASASLKKWCPTPKSQGQYGTCVGWSTAYAARTIIEAKANKWTDKTTITNNTFSPGFIYKQIKSEDDNNCSQGSSIEDALTIMKTKGCLKYDAIEEKNCLTDIAANLFTKAAPYKIKDFAKIYDLGEIASIKIQATKKSLSEGKPVLIGMSVPSSFDYPKLLWEPTEDVNGSYGGHAMCVIGYDDNQYGGAFEIQNSWGETWGNGGYIWVKYKDYANFAKYAFELFDLPQSNNNVIVTNEFSGSVKYQLSEGAEMKAYLNNGAYKMYKQYRSGTRFRLYISNNEPAYVYAIGFDGTLKSFQIFPHKENLSPYLNYKQNDVAIPDENSFIEMDNTVGTDYLCVLYSMEALNIETVMASIESNQGTFAQRIKAALGDKLVDFNQVQYYTNDQIGFKAKSTNKTVVALIVAMEHIQ